MRDMYPERFHLFGQGGKSVGGKGKTGLKKRPSLSHWSLHIGHCTLVIWSLVILIYFPPDFSCVQVKFSPGP